MNIAVFIDGTTNDHTDRHVTNVLKMRRLLANGQTGLYLRGVGNEFDNEGVGGFFGRVLGGAFGAGSDAKCDAAYDALEAAHQEGDTVFVFGFSRGAAIARMLCARVHEDGLNGTHAPIRMLGCFDTVASFGIPGDNWNLFKDFHVSPSVMEAYHAVALDETRDTFPPTLMNRREGINEVWFKGDHSDVGGGRLRSGLSDMALCWMIANAQAAGLGFVEGWDSALRPNLDQDAFPPDTRFRLHSPRIPGVLVDGEFHEGGHETY